MNVKSFYFGWLLSFLFFGYNPAKAGEKVIHTREVYKVIDSFKLTIDVFHTHQSYEHDNNTAIVFFHGGGWAFGTPDEFFTTCERYAEIGIVTFSVDYRLSIDKGVTPSKTISPIEAVMDARSAMRWVRENAAKFHLDKNAIVVAGQ